MFRILIVVLLISIFSPAAKAQSVDSSLISRFRPGIMWFYSGLRPSHLVDARKYDRLVVDLVHHNWTGEGQKLFQHWSSIGWNAQVFFDIPLTPKNAVALGIGLGYGHTRLRFDDMLQRIDSNKTTTLADFPANSGIDKSIFRSNKIFVPVELRFRTPGWKHVKLHVGGRIGYQFRASSSLYSKISGHKTETRIVGFHDLNPFILSANARLGIRNFALTASYNITPYFKDKSSAQLNGLEFGISISLF